MKKYLLLLLMVSVLFVDAVRAQQAKVVETIQLFPYQHRPEVDAAIAMMNTWVALTITGPR